MEFGIPFLLEMQSVDECCILARELGMSFVELNANFPACQLECLDPAELHRLSRQYGLYFTLHMEEECDPFTFNRAVRAAWLKNVRHGLTLAAALHMPIVNMHFPHGVYITLPGEKVYLYEKYGAAFYAALTDFRAMCEDALVGASTRIAIENTNGWRAHERQAIDFLLHSDVFGLTLDMGHSHCVENADEPFFRKHDDKLIHMHGHDASGKKNHLALGDGEINLKERFAWAAARGARIVLETKTIQALRDSFSRLPEYLPQKING